MKEAATKIGGPRQAAALEVEDVLEVEDEEGHNLGGGPGQAARRTYCFRMPPKKAATKIGGPGHQGTLVEQELLVGCSQRKGRYQDWWAEAPRCNC